MITDAAYHYLVWKAYIAARATPSSLAHLEMRVSLVAAILFFLDLHGPLLHRQFACCARETWFASSGWTRTKRVDPVLPIRFGCRIHTWMYVHLVNHLNVPKFLVVFLQGDFDLFFSPALVGQSPCVNWWRLACSALLSILCPDSYIFIVNTSILNQVWYPRTLLSFLPHFSLSISHCQNVGNNGKADLDLMCTIFRLGGSCVSLASRCMEWHESLHKKSPYIKRVTLSRRWVASLLSYDRAKRRHQASFNSLLDALDASCKFEGSDNPNFDGDFHLHVHNLFSSSFIQVSTLI